MRRIKLISLPNCSVSPHRTTCKQNSYLCSDLNHPSIFPKSTAYSGNIAAGRRGQFNEFGLRGHSVTGRKFPPSRLFSPM